ncbi:MAG: N-6 DNA methylase [Nitrospira sp.]|nr:N-6 DNA methylase [Nitrospira sp.]MDI3464026.1 XamI DNA methyltransferase [Nitrospira sp.]
MKLFSGVGSCEPMVLPTTQDSLFRLADRLFKSCRSRRQDVLLDITRKRLLAGQDLLGEVYGRVVPAEQRRAQGATFTPPQVVRAMVAWAKTQGVTFERIIDPGAGSGRFVLAAAQAFPDAHIIAVEKDPHIASLLRANIAFAGLIKRVSIIIDDYRSIHLPSAGRTLFIGNPPYVRHHDIEPRWKRWYTETFRAYGLPGSALAGLHLHFLLKTRQLAVPGDYGCFITAAEWLDVNYGSTARAMLMNGMGGRSLHLIDTASQVFPDTMTSAAVVCFEIGSCHRSLSIRRVQSSAQLGNLQGGMNITFSRAESQDKWSHLIRPNDWEEKSFIKVGELFKVHRGQVTGMNKVWIAAEQAEGLPTCVLVPAVTRAKELIQASNSRLTDARQLRRVVDLPNDFSRFSMQDRKRIETFMAWAQSQGAKDSYIAAHRRPWWRVNLRAPAPILMTYMARRAPVFVRNACGARILNIAHGLYPLVPLSESDLMLIIRWLNANVRLGGGRTYVGGLTKFEPGEVTRLPIPRLEQLRRIEIA